MIYYELVGEEYISDGVWGSVTICKGTKAKCNALRKLEERGGQYRDMHIRFVNTEKLCPCQKLKDGTISFEEWERLTNKGNCLVTC